MNVGKRILIVEDDANLGLLLLDFLEMEGYTTKLCRDGESGERAFLSHHYDLCILDCTLPEMDGFMLAKQIRKKNTSVPIVFLTARSFKEDKIKGFQIGADDYITKPFEIEELVLRLRAILKRTQSKNGTELPTYSIGTYEFDFKNQGLKYGDQLKRLTFRESEILRLLCHNRNEITRKEEILNTIWGTKDYFTGRSLDVFIAKLRKYLNEDQRVSIESVHSVGFILHAPS